MKFFVFTSSEEEYKRFQERHSFLGDCVAPVDAKKHLSASVNEILEKENEPVLLMQEDVFFNPDFLSRTQGLYDDLNARGDWGCAGESGTCCMELGFSSTKDLNFSFGPDRGPNYKDGIYPAQCLTGKVLLVNTSLLKEHKIALPETDNLLLLTIALGLESLRQGLPIFIANSLFLTYEKPASKKLLRAAEQEGRNYFTGILAEDRIETPYGIIKVKKPSGELHLREKALANASKIGKHKTVTIAVRTQFKRPELLKRCIDSIRNFQKKSEFTEFQLKIITDCRTAVSLEEYGLKSEEVQIFTCKNMDTRFELVENAIEKASGDYIWFIDDDDWIISRYACLLSETIESMPGGMTYYLGAEHYWEPNLPTMEDNCISKAEPAHYLDPAIFPYAFSGRNPVPFSAVIFPVKTVQGVLKDLQFPEQVSYFEDYLLITKNMLHENFSPAVLPELFSGISIRNNGNTVFESDRTNWNRSLSVVLYNSLESPNAVAFSLPVNRRVKHLASEYSKPPYGFATALLVFANKAFPWFGKKAVSKIPQCKRNYGVNECFRDQWNMLKENNASK